MEKSEQKGKSVGRMIKRKERMADGRRYMIYYTFEPAEDQSNEKGKQASRGKNKNV